MGEPLYKSGSQAWIGHQSFAIQLVGVLRPSLIVELGVQWGDSYFSFCQGIQESGIDCRIFGIDTWKGDLHSGKYGEEVFEKANAYNYLKYQHFSQFIRSTFTEARPSFKEGSVDLLHIDGYHTYEAVSHDFFEWKSSLSDKGVVLLHDVCAENKDFGVDRFFDEQKALYPHFLFTHSNGLGVLVVGKNVEISPLKALIEQFGGN